MRVDVSQNYLEYMSRLTGTKDFGNCKTIAFWDDELLAVVLYNCLDEANCQMSIASSSPKWATKVSLKVAFSFPFIQLGLGRVSATIRESNQKSISLAERLGFKQEGMLREYYLNGENALIYGLLKRECNWL